jgi:hypothetical protein
MMFVGAGSIRVYEISFIHKLEDNRDHTQTNSQEHFNVFRRDKSN